MATANLSQTTKMEQKLSAQMLQSLALLPMTAMELQEHIAKEIESNPALEIPDRLPSQGVSGSVSDSFNEMLENTPAAGETLSEHLLKQLAESEVSDDVEEVAKLLIGNLDQNGFHMVDLPVLFENTRFNAKTMEVSDALSLVQSFDPYGICAKDFRESLVIQARCSGLPPEDLDTFSKLVYNHLEDMEAGRKAMVAYTLKITEQDLDTFYSILKSFTPYPGRLYGNDMTNTVVPEFAIKSDSDGSLKLVMNRANLPDLAIASGFEALSDNLSGPDANQAKDYIRQSLQNAKNLISQVQLRYQTLYRTAVALMQMQEPFFKNGPTSLRSLTMKEMALMTGVHESTISRLAQSKWIDTDWGTYPLRYFFSQGSSSQPSGASSPSLSRNAVKQLIADMLKGNPKLSDQKISDALAQQGIECSRRTVNKYRNEL